MKEPFYFYVDKKEPTEKGGTIVGKKELIKMGIIKKDDDDDKKHKKDKKKDDD
jgi:hypothetical protein